MDNKECHQNIASNANNVQHLKHSNNELMKKIITLKSVNKDLRLLLRSNKLNCVDTVDPQYEEHSSVSDAMNSMFHITEMESKATDMDGFEGKNYQDASMLKANYPKVEVPSKINSSILRIKSAEQEALQNYIDMAKLKQGYLSNTIITKQTQKLESR